MKLSSITALDVDQVRDWLEVCWVAALTDTAQVIEIETRFDGADEG